MSLHTLLLFYLNLKLCEQITIQNEWCFLRWESVGVVSWRLANTRAGAPSPACCLLFSLSSSSDLASPIPFLSFLADSLTFLGSKNTSSYTVLATCVDPCSKGSCVGSLMWSSEPDLWNLQWGRYHYRWWNWSTEKLSSWPRAIGLGRGWAGIWTQALRKDGKSHFFSASY